MHITEKSLSPPGGGVGGPSDGLGGGPVGRNGLGLAEVINHAAYIAASESNMANLDISQKHLTEAMNRTNFGILKFLEERRISSVSGEDWA